MGDAGCGPTPPIPHPASRIPLFCSPMPLSEAILQALQTAWSHKLRSFFTLLGIIVSVGFLVAVVAVIQGMNAYVRERIAGAIVGVNAFQIRRDPIQVGFIDDEAWKKIQRRPRSEEHTSELQSQSNLVCRLLLEKKKKKHTPLLRTRAT